MAVIKPFQALRPIAKVAHLVASVPYDVVNREEAAELAKNKPLNFIRITRAEIELQKKTDPYDPQVYTRAGENLERLKEEAPLIQDEVEHFYLYRLIMGKQVQVGIAAAFSVDDYDKDVIMKHEKTRRVKEDDRTNHIVTTKAQTGAVFLTYRGVENINKVVENTTIKTEPQYDFTSRDGIQHTIWTLPPEYDEVIVREIKKIDKLYIADGHHRAASASRARKVFQENNPGHTGNEEYNFFLAVLFPAEQLNILPYNRVVHYLKGLSDNDFLAKIGQYFTVEPTKSATPPGKRSFVMYFRNKWYLLRPNEAVQTADSVAENLDVGILQNYLLNPILGIEDPRTDENIDFIGGIRGTKELKKLVDSGHAEVAFSMFPVAVEDLINISDAGEVMPPKSTWFEPKLRDGLLVHVI